MKLISREEDRTLWLILAVDREGLLLLLEAGSTRPGRRPGVSRQSSELNQRLQDDLFECLEEKRLANHSDLTASLRDPLRCVEGKGGFAWTLTLVEMEQLLQGLNALRISAWERLGCPDPNEGPDLESMELGSEVLLDGWILELASRFQTRVLHGLENG
jgi:hypothetical protein